MNKVIEFFKVDLKIFFLTLTVAFFALATNGYSQSMIVSHDFNDTNDGWILSASTNGTWARGIDILNGFSDGTNYWYTSASDYSNDAVLIITSPPLDLAGIVDMSLSIDLRYDTESEYDGLQIEYNDGGGWSVLGDMGDGYNWYNDDDVNAIDDNEHGWTGDSQTWLTAIIGLPAVLENNPAVQFRIRFESDGSGVDVGVAFDNFSITSGGAEIIVSGNGLEIENQDITPREEDNTNFYAVDVSSGSKTKVFDITNAFGGTLTLNGATPVSISGTNADDFSVVQPTDVSLSSGESTTFSVSFDAGATGVRYATITIDNSDSDESSYSFDIIGTGVSASIVHNFNVDDNGWSLTSDWTRGTDAYDEGADGDFLHLTNMSDYLANTTAIATSPTFNFSGLSDLILYMDIRYDTETEYDGWQVEYNDGGGWAVLGSIGEGVNWYNYSDVSSIGSGQDGWSGHNVMWETVELQLPASLNGNSTSQFRVTFASDGIGHDIGVAFDNFMISAGEGDLQVSCYANDVNHADIYTSYENGTDFRNVDVTDGIKSITYTIMNRGGGTLNLTGASPVTVGGADASDFTVTDQPASSSLTYLEETTFTVEFDPSSLGSKIAEIYIASDDLDVASYTFAIGGTGDNALYHYDFDASDEGWVVTENTNGDWVRGSAILSSGSSGSYWHTDPSTYSSNASLVIESPTLDFSSSTEPFLSFDLRYDTEDGNDGVKIEYSDDDGSTWSDLGQIGNGINWYNDSDVDGFANNEDAWTGDNFNWLTSEIELPLSLVGNTTVKFRFLFASGSSTEDVGAGFDNFAIYGAVIALPVELISFNGAYNEDVIELSWVTASEINNDYFEVQRSIDGENFISIGVVDGNGTSTVAEEYHFVDQEPSVFDNYYRLLQMDYDGNFEIHPMIKVSKQTGSIDARIVTAYPNPSKKSDRVFVNFDNYQLNERISYAISDISGKLLFSESDIMLSEERMELTHVIPSMSGVFIVHLYFNNAKKVVKIIRE